jgi:hypothetical protein
MRGTPKGTAVYMVIFRTADGKPGYQQAEGVQDAISSVERLRNEDGVDSVRIFRMEEVAFEYKVHYSVQLSDVAEAAPAVVSAAAPPVEETSAPADELAWDDETAESPEPSPPFDQLAVDPAGAPRWDDTTESHESDDADSEVSEADARRGLFGR